MATDNEGWGYSRIAGELSKLRYTISRSSVKRILKEYGIESAPERLAHMPWSRFLKTHLIPDRDPLYAAQFRAILKSGGVEVVRLPPRSPNLNAFAERFVLSIKSECLDRMIPVGERHLRHAIDEFVDHYHVERTHQGLGNQLIDGVSESRVGPVQRPERLGGLLSSYYREAA